MAIVSSSGREQDDRQAGIAAIANRKTENWAADIPAPRTSHVSDTSNYCGEVLICTAPEVSLVPRLLTSKVTKILT